MLERISSLGSTEWIIVFLFTIFLSLVGNILFRSRFETIDKRIATLEIFSKGTNEDKFMQKSLFQRLYFILEEHITLFLTRHLKKGKLAPLKVKLLQANDHVTDPIQHWSKKIIFSILAALLISLTKNFTLVILVGGLAFIYPDYKLKEKIKKRQLKLKSELPDFLDLLAATAASAKNLEDAINKVCDRSEGQITLEFRRALEEVNAGRRMRDALNDFSLRCGIAEIDTLVSQINQAEVFGTGIEKTLIVQAEKIRKLKKLLAEIKARKAKVTLLLPSLFLLTTVMIMIAGPSIVQFIDSMGALK